MDPALYRRFFEIEDTMWWSVWVRDMVRDWLGPENADASRSILDLGCGTGALSAELSRYGTVVSLDYAPDALPFCRERGVRRLLRADGQRLPFRDNTFDVLVALDTLEHIPDDLAAAREIQRTVKPGGTIIINVPALDILWSHHDVINHHHRRYSRPQLESLLQDAGMNLVKLTYSNMILFLPTLIVRLFHRAIGSNTAAAESVAVPHPLLNRIFYAMVSAERSVVRSANLPIGTSVFAVAKNGQS